MTETRVVPVEPTASMLSAGCDAIRSEHMTGTGECQGIYWGDARACYEAMLAAAPPETPVDDVLLPCDVRVAPSTTIRAGCKMSTLLDSIESRRDNNGPYRFERSMHQERIDATPGGAWYPSELEIEQRLIDAGGDRAHVAIDLYRERMADQGGVARDATMWRWCLKHDAFPSFDDANSRPPWHCVVNGRAYYGDTAAECVDTAIRAQAQGVKGG